MSCGEDSFVENEKFTSLVEAELRKIESTHLLSLRRMGISNAQVLTNIPGAEGLTEINLSWNKIRQINFETFGSLPNVSVLNLQGNIISQLKGLCADTCPSVQTINLSENQLQEIPTALFDYCPNLTSFICDANSLTTLPASIDESRSCHLETLSISGNKLPEIPFGTLLASRSSLNILNLSDNKISSIPPEIDVFVNLSVLEIGANQISSLPESLFNLTRLTSLSISRNEISHLSSSISQLTNLRRLDLSFNEFTSLPQQSIVELSPSLTLLDLRGNPIIFSDIPILVSSLPSDHILLESDPPDMIRPNLWLGSYNAAKNKHWLKRHNITHILTVAKGLDNVPRDVCLFLFYFYLFYFYFIL